jgi:hypothetical protein
MAEENRYSLQEAPDRLLQHAMRGTYVMSKVDQDPIRQGVWKSAYEQAADEWARRKKQRPLQQAADDSEQQAASQQSAIEDVMERRRRKEMDDLLYGGDNE